MILSSKTHTSSNIIYCLEEEFDEDAEIGLQELLSDTRKESNGSRKKSRMPGSMKHVSIKELFVLFVMRKRLISVIVLILITN